MLRKIMAGGLVALAVGTLPGPAAAQVYVEVAPPPPRVEHVPPPRRGHVWVAGHWEWRPHGYRWVPGLWMAERPGYRYHGPEWIARDGRWYMERGRWERNGAHGDRDHDGIANRHDRDRDGDGVPNRYDSRPDNPHRS